MKLNLGCCDRHRFGYVNVDLFLPADQLVDLSKPWPWQDSCIDEIYAADIIEHLPDKRHTMNEAWRVLQPDGQFVLEVPTTDGRGAFQDPTHVSYWTPNDLLYYTSGDPHRERFGKSYGVIASFRVLEKKHVELPDKVWKLYATLEAVK